MVVTMSSRLTGVEAASTQDSQYFCMHCASTLVVLSNLIVCLWSSRMAQPGKWSTSCGPSARSRAASERSETAWPASRLSLPARPRILLSCCWSSAFLQHTGRLFVKSYAGDVLSVPDSGKCHCQSGKVHSWISTVLHVKLLIIAC